MDTEYWDIETGEPLTENDLRALFDDFIDDMHDNIVILGMSAPASDVLREFDPIAHRVEFSDWLDSEIGQTITDENPDSDDTDEATLANIDMEELAAFVKAWTESRGK
jgi:hypothetical protein